MLGPKVTSAVVRESGQSKVANRNESAATKKNSWVPKAIAGAAVAGGVAVGGLALYNALPSMPRLPSVGDAGRAYTSAVGGAYRDLAFVPNAAQSETAIAQRAVLDTMRPGTSLGVQYPANTPTIDPSYTAPWSPPTPTDYAVSAAPVTEWNLATLSQLPEVD
jgi:hypothetical protein